MPLKPLSFFSILFILFCTSGDKKRDEGLVPPEDVIRYDNIQYGKSNVHNMMDIYRPKNMEEQKLPVLVDVHGGGWVYGDKELYQYYCMSMAQRGFAVINFTYTLAPLAHYPKPLEETNQVLEFVFENAEKYGFDTSNIFLAGDSAGANIASHYCAICADKEYAKEFDFKVPENFIPRGVLLNCGIYDFHAIFKKKDMFSHITKKLIKDYLGAVHVSEKESMAKSPVNHISTKYPPVFIMGANNDDLSEQIPLMTTQFDKFGVKYESKIYGTDKNPLNHVFHCNMKSEDARICNDEEAAFLKSCMVK